MSNSSSFGQWKTRTAPDPTVMDGYLIEWDFSPQLPAPQQSTSCGLVPDYTILNAFSLYCNSTENKFKSQTDIYLHGSVVLNMTNSNYALVVDGNFTVANDNALVINYDMPITANENASYPVTVNGCADIGTSSNLQVQFSNSSTANVSIPPNQSIYVPVMQYSCMGDGMDMQALQQGGVVVETNNLQQSQQSSCTQVTKYNIGVLFYNSGEQPPCADDSNSDSIPGWAIALITIGSVCIACFVVLTVLIVLVVLILIANKRKEAEEFV